MFDQIAVGTENISDRPRSTGTISLGQDTTRTILLSVLRLRAVEGVPIDCLPI